MTKPGATDACREERQPAGAMAMSDQRSPSGRGLGEHDMGSQPDTGREVRSERRYRARPPRDENWFEAIYRTHELAVRKYVVRRASAELADDVVSEVFTTLWRCRNDAPERVLPWLYGVAANHFAHLGRTQARRQRLYQKLLTQPGPGPVTQGLGGLLSDK